MHIFSTGVGSRRVNRSVAGTIFIVLVLLLVCAFMSLPFVYSIIQSLKPLDELFMFPPRFFVQQPTLSNFRQLLSMTNSLWVPFERYIFNSLFITVVGTFISVLISSMAAYPLAMAQFPGSRLYNQVIVYALLFSSPVIGVAQYILIAKTNMLDTYFALLLPSLSSTLGLFLMRQFMTQMIPVPIIESGKIDGASTFRIFWKLVMPMVRPAWLTLIIFSMQTFWNGNGSNYIYSEELKVLPTVLNQIASSGIARAGVAAAAAVVLMVPPILVYVIAQRNVLETMASSGIKE